MGYDYVRNTTLGTGLALILTLALVLDTVGGILLFLGSHEWSTSQAYDADVSHYTWDGSIIDVVLLNTVKALLLCFFYSFAILHSLSLMVTAASVIYTLAKVIVYQHSAAQLTLPPTFFLAVSVVSSFVELMAVYKTTYSSDDPDTEIADRVKDMERALQDRQAKRARAAENGRDKATDGDDYLLINDHGDEEDQQQSSTPPKSRATTMLYELWMYAEPDRGILIAGFIFILLSSLGRLALPNFASRCLTAIIQAATLDVSNVLSSSEFVQNIFYFTLCAVGMACFTGMRIWCTAKVEVRLIARLQRILFAAIIVSDIEYFDENGTGSLTSRLSSDATLLGSILTTNCNVAIQSSINLFGSSIFLFTLNPKLAGVYLAILISFFSITRRFGAYAKKLQARIQALKAEANQVADQAISQVRVVRAFATEDFEKNRYSNKNYTTVKSELQVKMVYTIYVPIVFVIQNGLALCVILYGGYLVSRGEMSPADLTAFYFYSTTVQEAMQSLAENILSLLAGLGAGEAIFAIIRQRARIPVKGGRVPTIAARGEVAVDKVTFRYKAQQTTGTGPVAMDGVDFRVEVGERLAIVGLSGSGKSTILNLLLRYYNVESGRILFDGQDIRGLDPRWLKGQLGVVTQDPMLMAVSLRENIAYGNDSATDEEVQEAAKMASIHNFITSLPEGYNTVVGERGVTLSGGERQRVGIARALLRRPKILILDEATSALDAQSESEVLEAIKSLHERRHFTMITIAHRLSTIQDSDRILVFSKGHIVEEGTHQQLLQKDGVYKALVQRQLQDDTIFS